MLKFTGAGPFAVTIPSVSKAYGIWNACAQPVTLTTGAGTTAAVQPGETAQYGVAHRVRSGLCVAAARFSYRQWRREAIGASAAPRWFPRGAC